MNSPFLMNNHLYLLQVSCSNIKLLFIFNLKKITSLFVFLRKLICWKETFTHNECINNNISTPIINIRSKSIFTNSNLRFEEYRARSFKRKQKPSVSYRNPVNYTNSHGTHRCSGSFNDIHSRRCVLHRWTSIVT